MKRLVLRVASALALVAFVAGCNQAAQQQEQDPGAVALARYSVDSFRGSNVTTEGGAITVRRAADGSQGVIIRPTAMMLHFTVEGEGAMLRVHQRGQIGHIPLQENNSVLIGEGGASQLLFFTRTGNELVIRVTGATDCTTAPDPAICTPATIEPIQQQQPTEGSPIRQ